MWLCLCSLLEFEKKKLNIHITHYTPGEKWLHQNSCLKLLPIYQAPFMTYDVRHDWNIMDHYVLFFCQVCLRQLILVVDILSNVSFSLVKCRDKDEIWDCIFEQTIWASKIFIKLDIRSESTSVCAQILSIYAVSILWVRPRIWD